MEGLPVFRAPKRRRALQQPRKDDVPTITATQDETRNGDSERQDETTSVIRVRKISKAARSGVIFSNNPTAQRGNETSEALVTADSSEEKLKDMSNRFVGSTGQVVDVDRHMVAFIDSEMAKRRQTQPATSLKLKDSAEDTGPRPPSNANIQASIPHPNHQHQLTEVQLEPPPPPTDHQTRRPPRKPRLGRDGKPLRPRPRPRKRRNSDDTARDAVVEQVLHEHRLDNLYQQSSTDPGDAHPANGPDGNAEHDERFAERFRQDFLDQVAERRQVQQKQKQKKPGTTGVPEKAHGPKLGGSRAARAKMMQQQQQQGQPSGSASGGQKSA